MSFIEEVHKLNRSVGASIIASVQFSLCREVSDQLTYTAPRKFKSSPSPLLLAPEVAGASPLRSQERVP